MRGDRLLVADDEPSLLHLLERYLNRLGFEVDATSTGREAWEKFQVAGALYRLIIIDLGLPDLPGEQLLDKVRAQRLISRLSSAAAHSPHRA